MTDPKISEYVCPQCGAAIPLDDINVSADIALCRQCGMSSSLSELVSLSRFPPELLDQPPRWTRLDEGFSGEKTITYRRPSPMLLFMVPFMAFWSGFSMWGIYIKPLMDGTFDPDDALFGIPFLIGTIILLGVVLYLAFGKWVVTLDHGTGSVFVGVGPIGRTRHFTYARNTIVAMRKTNIRVNEVTQTGILVKTGDDELLFGSLIKDNVKEYIAAMIQHESRPSRSTI